MTSSSLTYYTDRTTIETDWECQQRRYWYKDYAGHGLVPVAEPEYYKQGRDIHADYAAVMTGADAVEIVRRIVGTALAIQPYPSTFDLEQAWWHASMVMAFSLYIAPKWLASYDVWMVEKELVLNRPPLQLACTVDLGLQAKPNLPPRRIIIDYKSVRWLNKAWTDHWPYAVQMQINPKAAEEWSGERVDATYVVGLQKGEFRKGLRRHPYIYAYATPNGDDWKVDWVKSPYTLRGLWEQGSGEATNPPDFERCVEYLIRWVGDLGEPVGIEQHPMSAPIRSNPRLLDWLIAERTRREIEVRSGREPEPNFSACRPTIGSPCSYLAACHNAEVNADPIGSGLFVPRTPHHDQEWLMKESE